MSRKRKMTQVAVLKDGSFAEVSGCKLVSLPTAEYEAARQDGTLGELVEAYAKKGVSLARIATIVNVHA